MRIDAFDPRDGDKLASFVAGTDAVIFALGTDSIGAATFFSDVTAALIPAMTAHGVKRLVAITSVGVGETREHGGFYYDWAIFPLFTRKRYQDKERQEALITRQVLTGSLCVPRRSPNSRFQDH